MVLLMEFFYTFVEKCSILTETIKRKRYSLILTLQLLINLWNPYGTKFKKSFRCLHDNQAGINLLLNVFAQQHYMHLFFPFFETGTQKH